MRSSFACPLCGTDIVVCGEAYGDFDRHGAPSFGQPWDEVQVFCEQLHALTPTEVVAAAFTPVLRATSEPAAREGTS